MMICVGSNSPQELLTLQSKLPFYLPLPPLPLGLLLHLLPCSLSLLRHSLLTLCPLSRLIHDPSFHDALYNLASIHILEIVIVDLAVQVQCLGRSMRIVRQGHE
jgi:hypothetical protein